MKTLTAKEIKRKYKDKYLDIYEVFDYDTKQSKYEIRKVYDTIHENTTLGQDVGTELAYTR